MMDLSLQMGKPRSQRGRDLGRVGDSGAGMRRKSPPAIYSLRGTTHTPGTRLIGVRLHVVSDQDPRLRHSKVGNEGREHWPLSSYLLDPSGPLRYQVCCHWHSTILGHQVPCHSPSFGPKNAPIGVLPPLLLLWALNILDGGRPCDVQSRPH